MKTDKYTAVISAVDFLKDKKYMPASAMGDKKIKKMRDSYQVRSDETVLLVIDDTIMGSGTDGVLFSDKSMYTKALWQSATRMPYESISAASVKLVPPHKIIFSVNGIEEYFRLVAPEPTLHTPLNELLSGIARVNTASKQVSLAELKSTAQSNIAKKREATRAAAQAIPSVKTDLIACGSCEHLNSADAKFCAECGQKLEPPKELRNTCAACGSDNKEGAKFCAECGHKLNSPPVCSACSAQLPENAKFCLECGTAANSRAQQLAHPDTESDPAEPEANYFNCREIVYSALEYTKSDFCALKMDDQIDAWKEELENNSSALPVLVGSPFDDDDGHMDLEVLGHEELDETIIYVVLYYYYDSSTYQISSDVSAGWSVNCNSLLLGLDVEYAMESVTDGDNTEYFECDSSDDGQEKMLAIFKGTERVFNSSLYSVNLSNLANLQRQLSMD